MQAPVLSNPVLAIPVLAGPPRGTYLRRCWYVVGWADALGESPQDRIFLEEPVALFRDEAGWPMPWAGAVRIASRRWGRAGCWGRPGLPLSRTAL
ncbi:hypothetical protein ACFS32_14200 [Novosphingobium pokkalii]|uniref:hypothetical protein n=1 Tax=Novosphingobium pokkalii TaxID=1770194 RepID=UPI0036455FD7